ncbi:hypothetical protein [Pseudonocardia acidicola]|uniref:Lipoprotein n=1 Tax=Pseudonocardia acidicola TaxID=2724939 RepID=A0ABX1SH71_9PSEU|nr:hypothetical protein [Pseudonocardia acidicola]NMI00916.1 hypothetical protein [Pseudonocardia acidicola]
MKGTWAGRTGRWAALVAAVVAVVVGCAPAAPPAPSSGQPGAPASPTAATSAAAPTSPDRPMTPAPRTTASKSSTTPGGTGSAATSRPSARTSAPAGRSWSTYITFYGAGDNDPPGTAIAHPNARHSHAGGTGTFSDPVTLASDRRELPVGTVLYYPSLRKYFVMEDDCVACIGEWAAAKRPHLDLWAGDFSGESFLACQEALTPAGKVAVEVNPPPGREVDTRSLYDGAGRCLSPAS